MRGQRIEIPRFSKFVREFLDWRQEDALSSLSFIARNNSNASVLLEPFHKVSVNMPSKFQLRRIGLGFGRNEAISVPRSSNFAVDFSSRTNFIKFPILILFREVATISRRNSFESNCKRKRHAFAQDGNYDRSQSQAASSTAEEEGCEDSRGRGSPSISQPCTTFASVLKGLNRNSNRVRRTSPAIAI